MVCRARGFGSLVWGLSGLRLCGRPRAFAIKSLSWRGVVCVVGSNAKAREGRQDASKKEGGAEPWWGIPQGRGQAKRLTCLLLQ